MSALYKFGEEGVCTVCHRWKRLTLRVLHRINNSVHSTVENIIYNDGPLLKFIYRVMGGQFHSSEIKLNRLTYTDKMKQKSLICYKQKHHTRENFLFLIFYMYVLVKEDIMENKLQVSLMSYLGFKLKCECTVNLKITQKIVIEQ